MNDAATKTPAGRLIARFGAPLIAEWVGRHYSRVHAWSWPTPRGGGGVVPPKLRDKIIKGAAGIGQTVTAADFELAAGEVWLSEREVA